MTMPGWISEKMEDKQRKPGKEEAELERSMKRHERNHKSAAVVHGGPAECLQPGGP